MVKRTTNRLLTLVLVFIAGITACVSSYADNTVRVGLLFNSEKGIHKDTVAGLKNAIEGHHLSNVSLVSIDTSDASNAHHRLNNTDLGYAIAVGVDSSKALLASGVTFPAISILVPENTYLELVNKQFNGDQVSAANFSAIYLEQKPARQVVLGKIIAGQNGVLGMTVGEYSKPSSEAIRNEADQRGLKVKVNTVKDNDDSLDVMRDTLFGSDAFLALYDPSVLNRHNAKWLLYMAYKNNKPVIGFSPSYTRAGAVASLYSTPEQIGRQAGKWLSQMILDGYSDAGGYADEFTVKVNKKVQRALRLKVMSEQELTRAIQLEEGGQ